MGEAVGKASTTEGRLLMMKRLQTLGIVLTAIGLVFLVGAGVAYTKVQAGYDSLHALSAAQNVQLELVKFSV